ncbi:hypothetical protein [Sphingomonas adhaesiva]|uniref:hypothetical protein n=1 Tax=Sphingomonas adhaesiva TaxID=28212 RepID=UPI002FFA1BEF
MRTFERRYAPAGEGFVQPRETFRRDAHSASRHANNAVQGHMMKQFFPLVLALVPLAAVVGACVAVP